MIRTKSIPDPRGEALRFLTAFCSSLLPGVLRRIATWKGLSLPRLRDYQDDITQELAVDCLIATETVLALSTEQRHARWMRLTERWVYRQLVRTARRRVRRDLELLSSPDRPVPARVPEVPPRLVLMKNGRCCLSATAKRLGRDIDTARHELRALAARCELDGTDKDHWQRRLAEALTGLAADLLRLGGRLRCLPSDHPPPDPEARLRRIHRLAPRFAFHATDLAVRRIVAHWKRVRRTNAVRPRIALEHAVALTPDRPEGWLWLFEAAVDEGRGADAGRALLGCRRCGRYPRGRVTLARARLLEARGRWREALALLRRARRRWPADPWVRRAFQVVSAC